MHDHPIQQQIEYYRARAAEYEEWFFRQKRYDRGPELNRQWFVEVAKLRSVLRHFQPRGHVLELACGTGLWTQQLVRYADRVTAVDASPEALELNRARVRSKHVDYVRADIFNWRSEARYDLVFFSFWLSHVPPDCFESFWRLVRSCLHEHGRVFFIDSLYEPTSTARDHRLNAPQSATVTRRLNDGRVFDIVKIFYKPAELEASLKALGWSIKVESTGHYFLYGNGGVAIKPELGEKNERTLLAPFSSRGLGKPAHSGAGAKCECAA
ncbi:methyltransferase domain-containing protein [candidate division KSB1 bacterium]|nr:methyltransferase domain-containing protein [candidate division KSB1 bacterium]